MENKLFKYGVFTKNRVETFSDGIFAIIVTLLILEVKVPHIEHSASALELSNAIVTLLPKFASWVISFLTICIVWVNHHRLFETFKGINIVLFWLNVHLLLWVCFVPFPTALIGDYPHNPLAVAFYGIVLAFIGLAFFIARLYGLRHRALLKDEINLKAYKKSVVFAFFFGFLFYLASATLAWVHTYLSFTAYFLIAMYFVFSFATKKLHNT
ncbi:MAG: TMEM175 family protein [Candidatus Omnitrophota bacterium]